MDNLHNLISLFYSKLPGLWSGLLDDFSKDIFKYIGGVFIDRVYLYIKKKFQPQLQLIGADPGDKWTVYFGNIPLVDFKQRVVASEESGSKQYIYGDIESTLLVSEIFCSWFDTAPKYSRFFPSPDKLENVVISVGGPKWNRITEYLIGALGSPVYFKDRVENKGTFLKIKGFENKIEYKEAEVNNVKYISDVGVIIIGKGASLKDKNSAKSVCVLTGYSVYGVRLAAEYLKKIKLEPKKYGINKIKEHSKICLLIKGNISIDENGEVISPLAGW
ncbi:hypothetical protein JWZ98_03655 [Methylomonas sp. EFPC1]|uniref:hypothetical protein n=1 Tax=Methylomonas sp. EFPC1 TaxID=2812647 RepID=UPI001967DD59|nr:hypothetical protein [Methylomonas sp. EFPC1]QSB02069.1 hypothetical protein JWZ98_03655 [Methylomonas sp. EFPC1]